MMTKVGQKRTTQVHVVKLFTDTQCSGNFGYSYLGKREEEQRTCNIKENALRKFLRESQGYNDALITKATHYPYKAFPQQSAYTFLPVPNGLGE